MPQRLCPITIASCALLPGALFLLAACGAGAPAAPAHQSDASRRGAVTTGASAAPRTSATGTSSPRALPQPAALRPLATPADLRSFRRSPGRGEGIWHAAGRRVEGMPAVYVTTIVPPGGSQPAGVAWMDTELLKARLYSGSESPGGGPYRYTAPIGRTSARTLVAAFNGGFKMEAAEGGYYAEGRTIDPLRAGAASLVFYANGSVDVGEWGSDVRMTPQVVAVRQNLVPLVAQGRPTPRARSADWQAWGATCGESSCASSVPGIERQWRSAVGVTGDGALVYVQGPALDPLQLASLLVRAGVVRGMELDINPDWPIFATYDPAGEEGSASAANGHGLLPGTVRSPGIFFEAWWARDFITMSARQVPPG